jgi:hypothetical protein
MRSISGNPGQDLKAAAVEEGESQQITDLIEQLNRDFEETQKHACKP